MKNKKELKRRRLLAHTIRNGCILDLISEYDLNVYPLWLLNKKNKPYKMWVAMHEPLAYSRKKELSHAIIDCATKIHMLRKECD